MENITVEELHCRVKRTSPPPYHPAMRVPEKRYSEYKEDDHCGYLTYLNAIVQQTAPRKILELGSGGGHATLFMMLALPSDSSLITVDIQDEPWLFLYPFEKDPRVTVIKGDDRDISIFRGHDIGGIDLLYIDSLHLYPQKSKEWSIYKSFLAEGAVVVMDDINFSIGMEQFWKEVSFPKVDIGQRVHYRGFGMFAPFGHVTVRGPGEGRFQEMGEVRKIGSCDSHHDTPNALGNADSCDGCLVAVMNGLTRKA